MNMNAPLDSTLAQDPSSSAADAAPNGRMSDMADPSSLLAASTIPNSKPREQSARKLQTYVYQDFATVEPVNLNTGTCHERVPPQSLQSQKLPSKLAAMLQDPDLASVITWMPHGRSWKVLNREMFSSFALPRYFGHSNHASFVRIVNAWGFRRITKGPDRDSYYHELFLRGKPRLHERMKRLPTCHRKTPVDKDDKCPDFYELAKTSPLPEVSWTIGGPNPAVTSRTNTMAAMNQMSSTGGIRSNPVTAQAALGLGNPMLGFGAASGSMGMGMGNDMSSFLQLLRQQQGATNMQQQPSQSQPQAVQSNGDIMNQLLRMQSASNAAPSGAPAAGNYNMAQGLGSMNMSQGIGNFMNPGQMGGNTPPNPAQRRPSGDKISVNDVLQLRSIERTNELLAQKLALMQGQTSAMKQGSAGGNAPVKSEPSAAATAPAPSPKEQMLLQMLRNEQSSSGGSSGAGNMNQGQGLNSLLQSLNGMQQQQQQP